MGQRQHMPGHVESAERSQSPDCFSTKLLDTRTPRLKAAPHVENQARDGNQHRSRQPPHVSRQLVNALQGLVGLRQAGEALTVSAQLTQVAAALPSWHSLLALHCGGRTFGCAHAHSMPNIHT